MHAARPKTDHQEMSVSMAWSSWDRVPVDAGGFHPAPSEVSVN